jgi:hypothetical protein
MDIVAIHPGRTILLGPDWLESDATLAFDACSGDYWVLDGLGRFIVERLLEGRTASPQSLQAEVSSTPAIAHAADDLAAGIAGLLEAGLLQTVSGAPY